MAKTHRSVLLIIFIFSVSNIYSQKNHSIGKTLEKTEQQLNGLLKNAITNNRIPRTVNDHDSIHWANPNFDWTEGFFPGICWYMYEYSGDKKWEKSATQFQNLIYEHRHLTNNHDLGFVFNCSFGNGFRITNDKKYKKVLIDAATSLLTRFNPKVGCIKSWDVDKGWQSERGWKYPVIIDNMMNLELLFKVSELTGDPSFKEAAISHANTTIKNHFRGDFSSYHVVDYDPETGAVRHKHRAQGFSHESRWSRGQAWGLYGYVVCYRFTKDNAYLEHAQKIADFIMNAPEIPEDKIPYWDYDSDEIPNTPRDASAAAITASAMVELSKYAGLAYKNYAVEIIKGLSSDPYFAKTGTNNHFILKHSVGSIPHGAEIDVPLIYADYYFVEALIRLNN